jgi:hypothetical protein
VVLVLALYGSALTAQQAPLVGAWRISYPGDLRIRNGVADPVMMNATLTVQAKGDSLIADLVTDSAPNRPARPALHLAGKAGNPEAVFITRSKATLNLNGNAQEANVINTWKLAARGDSLAGTIDRTLEGIDAPGAGPLPITGTRKKA